MLHRPSDPDRLKPEASQRLDGLRVQIARGQASGPGVAADEAFARVRARIDATVGSEKPE